MPEVETSLTEKIIEAIREDIPIDLMCPRCDYQMDAESAMGRTRWNEGDWQALAERIIKLVKEGK